MLICPKDKCTGCYACVNVCSRRCISMQEDKLGCVHPIVDEINCIHCGLCKSSCPNNVELKYSYPLKCYASWIEDKDKRMICASGGIGTCMSEYVIKQGGVVFGSRYDSEMTPIMTYTESMDELEHFKGSRYVQSLVGKDTYKKVKTFLHNGRLVLFIGTPCQVAGLKAFLHKDYDNLITVDLICHGVCPTKYFKEEVAYIIDKYNLKDIADIRFRGNDGNNYRLTLWDKDRRKLFPRDNYREKLFRIDETQQYYILGFLWGICLRENCYSCNYARPERIGDITIGDFIGLGKTVKFSYPKKNVSSVTVNTPKGSTFYSKVSENTNDLKNIERNYKERLDYKPSLVMPFKRHQKNKAFVEAYPLYGYVSSIRMVLKNEMEQRKKNNYLRLILFPWKLLKNIFRNK